MSLSANSFPFPDKIEPALERVRAYWQSLKRGENIMPFSDDIDPSRVPELSDQIMLLGVFENPERFRFEIVGTQVSHQYGMPLTGQFSDEMAAKPPLEAFTKQCTATVAQRAPTYYRSEPSGSETGYARIVLPTWGDGRVMLLLCAVAPI